MDGIMAADVVYHSFGGECEVEVRIFVAQHPDGVAYVGCFAFVYDYYLECCGIVLSQY